MTLTALPTLLRGRALVFTGAGISAASGLPTFRGDQGLYEGLNPYELASPEAFEKRPITVWNWYLARIHHGKGAVPNAAHLALAEMESFADRVTIVTSNVDQLHQQAGSKRVFRLHGDIHQTRCTRCNEVRPIDMESLPEHLDDLSYFRCRCGGLLRPNVVWFGEYPWSEAFEAVHEELPHASIVLEVGRSGIVSYGFTELALRAGAPVVCINPEGSSVAGVAEIREPAETALPRLVHLASLTVAH